MAFIENRKYRVQAVHPADGRVVSLVGLTIGDAMAKADELFAAGYLTVNVSTPEQASGPDARGRLPP